MIFVVIESHMNGTVTMGITALGIEATTFEEAEEVVRENIAANMPNALVHQADSFGLRYKGDRVTGTLQRQPLHMLERVAKS